MTPLKAIKQYCKKLCCNLELYSWKNCSKTDCPLFCYRFGHKIKKQASFIGKEKQGEPSEASQEATS